MNLVSLHGVVLVVAVVWLVELPCCTYGTVQLFTERNGRHCRLDRISKLSKYRKNLESLAASKSQQPRTGRISFEFFAFLVSRALRRGCSNKGASQSVAIWADSKKKKKRRSFSLHITFL